MTGCSTARPRAATEDGPVAGHGEADRALHRRIAALAPTVFAWCERLAASPEGQALWTCRPRGQGCAASKAAG